MDGNCHLWWLTVLSLNFPGITFRDLSREGMNKKRGKGEGQEQKANSIAASPGPLSVRLTIFMSLVQRERRVRSVLLLGAPPQTKGVSAYLGVRLQGLEGDI